MAYKLYINNKLFNGIGNNNYNKGTIAINGTVYQYDNSSSAYVPTVYDKVFNNNNSVLDNDNNVLISVDSGSSLMGGAKRTTLESDYYTGTISGVKMDSKGIININISKQADIVILYSKKTGTSDHLKLNGVTIQGTYLTANTYSSATYPDVYKYEATLQADNYTIVRSGSENSIIFIRVTM